MICKCKGQHEKCEKIEALQARVKELEGQLCDAIDEINACGDLIDPRKAKEIVRLRKVVDAAREFVAGVVVPSAVDSYAQLQELKRLLAELDGEKKGQESAHKSKPRVKCSCICNCSELIEAGDHRCWGCLTTNCG